MRPVSCFHGLNFEQILKRCSSGACLKLRWYDKLTLKGKQLAMHFDTGVTCAWNKNINKMFGGIDPTHKETHEHNIQKLWDKYADMGQRFANIWDNWAAPNRSVPNARPTRTEWHRTCPSVLLCPEGCQIDHSKTFFPEKLLLETLMMWFSLFFVSRISSPKNQDIPKFRTSSQDLYKKKHRLSLAFLLKPTLPTSPGERLPPCPGPSRPLRSPRPKLCPFRSCTLGQGKRWGGRRFPRVFSLEIDRFFHTRKQWYICLYI